MRHYSLFARSGQIAGRGWRRAAVAAVLAALGMFAGVVPAQAGGWHSGLVFHPARVVYGSAAAGQARDRRFILVNSGRAFTGRLTFTITGPGAGGFTLRRNQCAGVSLPPGQSCSGVVQFAPRHASQYRAQLTARATRGTRPGTVTAALPLTGTGTAATAQVQSVSAGGYHTCAVKTDHTLWCWGGDGYGQLGDGTTAGSLVPVQVSGHATDWAAVSAGFQHACAVKTDHSLWCWGWNDAGQLGDGTTTVQPNPVPVQVSGHATGWAAVSAGYQHTCAVKTDGTLWCWGENTYGQLGDGTPGDSLVPVQVSGHATDWAAVSAGLLHTCAVKTDHSLWCWGYNGYGELGNGATTDSLVPVQVSGHATNWAAVTAGQYHTCAVKTDHTLWCWGENGYGTLGDGSTTSSPVPVQVSGHATDWAAVTAGDDDTCAVKTDHTLWCWGVNLYGELGDGSTTSSPVPVQVSGM
jgi:alpha-tubulin suppressor-like RCC1 family protein